MGMEHTFDSYFSETMNTPTMMASTSTPLTPPTADAVPTTIKMEDLQVPFDTPSPDDSYPAGSEPSSTPAPSGSESSRQVKKRKSWGQVLPEPKTTLPPRKRAKTEDEKEQRRIERVKRNRLAAHNSRERKRQEYELLQAEKDQMEADLKSFQQRVAQMEAEINFYRKKYPGEAPPPVFDLAASTNTSFDTVCPRADLGVVPQPHLHGFHGLAPRLLVPARDARLSLRGHTRFRLDTISCRGIVRPAVSVDFGHGLPLSGADMGLSYTLQPHAPVDEKPVVLDNLFDFDQFPEGSTTTACMEPSALADPCTVDFFGAALFGHGSSSIPYGLSDNFDAKFSDLQSASGATYVSDEVLAAEL